MADLTKTINALAGHLDYPMFVVTTVGGGERSGCLVGFATQTSIHPPRFLIGLSRKNRTFRVAGEAQHLGVHFLPVEREDLAELFGGETGDEVDKFARTEWHTGPCGVPIVEGCRNWFVGRIVERLDLGDHVGHLLEPVAAEMGTRADEFTFHRAKRIEPGHEA
jgi:flavin reductase (DIM6/NTAB) family NADH-FMN oxidoreductase RutF